MVDSYPIVPDNIHGVSKFNPLAMHVRKLPYSFIILLDRSQMQMAVSAYITLEPKQGLILIQSSEGPKGLLTYDPWGTTITYTHLCPLPIY